MELTVGYLKKVLEQLPDDTLVAHLGQFGNQDFEPFINVKRLIVVKDESKNKEWGGKTFLVINTLGTHFTKQGHQKPLKFTGVHFDRETGEKLTTQDK